MTNIERTGASIQQASSESWFSPGEENAAADLWSVLEANYDTLYAELLSAAAEVPASRASLARMSEDMRSADRTLRLAELRQAFAGRWSHYEASLRAQATALATAGVGFLVWQTVATRVVTALTPLLVHAYHAEPLRLIAALRALHRFQDTRTSMIYDEFQRVREAAEQQGNARKEAIFASALDAIVCMDHTGRITELNTMAEQTFGYSRDEAIGQLPGELIIPPALRDAHRQALEQYAATGVGTMLGRRIELTALRRDGSEFPVELAISSFDASGSPSFIGFIRDLSDRVRAEQARTSAEIRYRRLAESGIIGIQICDRAGAIIEANDAFLSIVGYSREDLASGRVNWSEMTPPEARERNVAIGAELAKNGAVTPWEKEYVRKDGTIVPVLVGVATLSESRSISVVADLSAQKRAEAQTLAQETRFRALIEQSDDGIALVTRDGTVSYITPAASRILGYPVEELLSRRVLDLVHPDDVPEMGRGMAQVRETPNARGTARYRVRRRDGCIRWIEAQATNRLTDSAVGAVVVNFRDITDVRRNEARLARLAESGILGIATADVHGRLVEANDAYLSMLGFTREDIVSGRMRWDQLTPPEWKAADDLAVQQLQTSGMAPPWEKELLRKDGTRVPVLIGVAMLDYPECIVVTTDLTSRKKAEAALRASDDQLRQAQKMEAIGRLAGGVAHDFNNVLSVILGYAQMLLSDLKPTDPMHADISEIATAGNRATALTRQLLMFGRQQVLAPRVLDLNEVLGSMEKMLRRLVGEDIDLVAVCMKGLGCVRADQGSIEQVLMNLVVNARDAMTTGGQLTLETSNVMLDEEYARLHIGSRVGPHVMLAVTDSGVGMGKATQARIFEPFFTTKEKGKGTGLGLSTVFGIVQQSGGSIWVYSEPSKGTTFKVYLPQVDEAATQAHPQSILCADGGTETILLVEDEEQVRAVAKSALRRHGYQVIEAGNAGEALLHCERHPQTIHLLLTDVVMPQMSGPELAKRLVQARPELRVLCMSGYTDDSVVRHGILDGEIAFLQKPFTPDTLAREVRKVLDTPRGRPIG